MLRVRTVRAVLPLLTAGLMLHPAVAGAQSDRTAPDSLARILHFLYAAAAVMLVVLAIVVLIAWKAFRRDENEPLRPNPTDDSTR